MTVSAIQSICILYHCIPEHKDNFVQEMTFNHIFNINYGAIFYFIFKTINFIVYLLRSV